MKPITLILAFLFSTTLLAQPSDTVKLIFLSCKSGQLIIDGEPVESLEPDHSIQKNLSLGEHHILLKSGSERLSSVIEVKIGMKSLVRLGCTEASSPENAAVPLLNKKLYLTGMIAQETDRNVFAFQKGDELIITGAVVDKKGFVSLYVTNVDNRQQVFVKESFNSLTNEKLTIPATGVYEISYKTDALFGKNFQLKVDRIPVAGGKPGFKTAVRVQRDTAVTEVLTTTARVYSQTNMTNPNKTIVKINLPANASYWAYWIGVGQKEKDEMGKLVTKLSGAKNLVSLHPVALFGLGLLSELPAFKSTETVSYRFTDYQNAAIFKAGQAYNAYNFKFGDNVSADYAIVKERTQDLVLCMTNNNMMTGFDVAIKVVAFVVNARWVIEEAD